MKILSRIATVLGPNKADTPVKSTKDVSEQQIQFLSKKKEKKCTFLNFPYNLFKCVWLLERSWKLGIKTERYPVLSLCLLLVFFKKYFLYCSFFLFFKALSKCKPLKSYSDFRI